MAKVFFSPSLTATVLVALATAAVIPNASAADVAKANYQTAEAQRAQSAIVYQYHPNSVYNLNTKKNFISDIQLQAGESITYIAGGETINWMIDTATVNGVPHVYIKPIQENVVTNLVVNTNRHTYRLLVFSEDAYNNIIMWEYPDEVREQMMKEQARPVYPSRAEKLYMDTHMEQDKNGIWQNKKLNYHYSIKNHSVPDDTVPTEIYDDGQRTYIKIPEKNKYDFPTLYLVNDRSELTLVNYRVMGQYLVADRVFSHGRIQYTQKAYIDFTPSKTTLQYPVQSQQKGGY